MKNEKCNYIWLMWRDHVINKSFVVGRLTKISDNEYTFEYDKDECKKLERFKPLTAFPNIEKVYTKDQLFATFTARIPPKQRVNIDEILKEYGLKEYDSFELLRKTGGIQPIDSFSFIESILDIDNPDNFYSHQD